MGRAIRLHHRSGQRAAGAAGCPANQRKYRRRLHEYRLDGGGGGKSGVAGFDSGRQRLDHRQRLDCGHVVVFFGHDSRPDRHVGRFRIPDQAGAEPAFEPSASKWAVFDDQTAQGPRHRKLIKITSELNSSSRYRKLGKTTCKGKPEQIFSPSRDQVAKTQTANVACTQFKAQ
ncbi:UNVERIFIED_CONTAM: hypothetical protein GTU68_060034 [Idotea baltica]|nr:hypothetical protein [Idotea baltica]